MDSQRTWKNGWLDWNYSKTNLSFSAKKTRFIQHSDELNCDFSKPENCMYLHSINKKNKTI